MKRLLPTVCLLSSVLCSLSSGADLLDLGQGLSYLRIHSVAESEAMLRKVVPGAGALVLDLRYATANDESAEVLKTALTGRPAGTPLFILVSPATPPAIFTAVAQSSALILGAPGSLPAPKVVVQTDAAADRRAYDALEAGAPLTLLVSGRIEKERFDEATLVQEFKNGNTDAELPPLPDPTAPAPGKPEGSKPVATPEKITPPTDRVLQRAVHLHRTLLALRRPGGQA